MNESESGNGKKGDAENGQSGPAEASEAATGEAATGEAATGEAATGERPSTVSFVDAPTDPSGKPPQTIDPLVAAQAEVAEQKEKYLRLAADFDNFRKRTRRDLDDAERRGRENLLKELLPVFDNLERAVVHANQASDAKSVAEGVKMVLRQFLDTLDRVGIKRVPTVGAPFDPNLHEAIQQLATADQPPGTVVAEVQPGYALGDKLIRAAMVVVAKAPQENA